MVVVYNSIVDNYVAPPTQLVMIQGWLIDRDRFGIFGLFSENRGHFEELMWVTTTYPPHFHP